MASNNFPRPPKAVELTGGYLRLLRQSLDYAMAGKLNCTGTVTLQASATTTPVTDNRVYADSVILLMPLTANAAGALATSYIQAADVVGGSFIITHANNAQTDRNFRYVIIG